MSQEKRGRGGLALGESAGPINKQLEPINWMAVVAVFLPIEGAMRLSRYRK